MHGTQKDAERYRNGFLRDRDLGKYAEHVPSKSLKKLAEEWMTEVAPARIKDQTLQSYRYQLVHYVVPEIGDQVAGKLEPGDIQAFYSRLMQRYSHRTVQYVHTVLQQVLRYGVRAGELERNACELVDIPRPRAARKKTQNPKDIRPMTQHQVDVFLPVCRQEGELLFEFLLGSGARPGEGLGLIWPDLGDDQVHIQRSLVNRRWSDGNRWDTPKTYHGRTVQLPASLFERLRQHRLTHPYDLVFCGPGGEPLLQRSVIRRFKALLKKAGLPTHFRVYDLRHTFATLMLAGRQHPKVISGMLGHASVKITLDTYSHLLPTMQDPAVEVMARILGDAPPPTNPLELENAELKKRLAQLEELLSACGSGVDRRIEVLSKNGCH